MTAPRYIRFELLPAPAGRTTIRWQVVARDGDHLLGIVQWYTGWRRYVFVPETGTLYDEQCLRDLATFLEDETRKRRARRGAS